MNLERIAMWTISEQKRSGTKTWYHLTAESELELQSAAWLLNTEIHGKGSQEKHLDINEHQRQIALEYGATTNV